VPIVLFLVFLGSVVLDSLRMIPVGLTMLAIVFVGFFIEMLRGEVIFSDYKLLTLFLLVASFIYGKLFGYSDSPITYILLFGAAFMVVSYFLRRATWVK
jgi:hypothetical protein